MNRMPNTEIAVLGLGGGVAREAREIREEIERLKVARDQVIDEIVDLINAEADMFLMDPHCTGEMRFTAFTMKAVALRICAFKK